MPPSRFVPGQHIGPYRLIRFLSASGYGEVWLSERATGYIGQRVALKLPFDPDEEMLRKGAQTWIRANGHPNIVPVLDADSDKEGQTYIACEYVDGGTLSDWLKDHGDKAPSMEAAVQMITAVLKGMEHLHAVKPNPIIHRDLNPDNILIQAGIPRITDFGMARSLRSTQITNTTSITPAYMAPEVFTARNFNIGSDLWAVGIIFYRLLTGRLPFPQDEPSSLMQAIVYGNPAPGDFTPAIQRIFTKAFQKNPAYRYPSAEAMRLDIEALLRLPQPIAQVQQAPYPPKSTPAQPPVKYSTSEPQSRRNFLWGIPIAGAIGYGIYFLTRNRAFHWSFPGRKRSHGLQPAPKSMVQPTPTKNTFQPNPPRTKMNSIDGAEMIWIPAGMFQMGGTGEIDGKPVHDVRLSGYWMYMKPVTVAQFRKYDDAIGRKFNWNKNKPLWGWIDSHPMVNVTWDEANSYAHWAGVALPTEAQWEKAARGGLEGKTYSWGDDWDGSRCANSVKPANLTSTQPVGSYPANGYGLYDMTGNVWEWCSDWYAPDYYKTEVAGGPDPVGPISGSYRVLRGGSWAVSDLYFFHCAYRGILHPDGGHGTPGFRCSTI